MGSPWALALAAACILVWALSGPYFGFSTSWQLVVNTGTTIVTFLMAFVIQSTTQRESKAINLKLDELLRATKGARTGFVTLDNLTDEELAALERELIEAGASAGLQSLAERRHARRMKVHAVEPRAAPGVPHGAQPLHSDRTAPG